MTEENSGILAIKPNPNDAESLAISDGLADLRAAAGPQIICETLDEGVFGVESQADMTPVIDPTYAATQMAIEALRQSDRR